MRLNSLLLLNIEEIILARRKPRKNQPEYIEVENVEDPKHCVSFGPSQLQKTYNKYQ
jgi:hypothetical protein